MKMKLAVCALGMVATTSAAAFTEAEVMSMRNTYAAHHSHVSTRDIAELSYERQRVEGDARR